jgi:hypothetical protein
MSLAPIDSHHLGSPTHTAAQSNRSVSALEAEQVAQANHPLPRLQHGYSPLRLAPRCLTCDSVKTATPQSDTEIKSPIRGWWGWHLLVLTVVAFVSPYLANEDDRLYSPAIATYHEVEGRLQPTTEKIWLDGRTAAELHRGHYLFWGLAPVLIQLLVVLISRILTRSRSKITAPQRLSPHATRPERSHVNEG